MPHNDDYLEWLAAAPKGVRWDKAQEMYALYQVRRKEQADAVAKRLLGNGYQRPHWVSQVTDMCVMCGRNAMMRWRFPECDGEELGDKTHGN